MQDFNKEQLSVINSDALQIAVLGSAGCGKTRTLVGRLARLIDGGADPRGIVVLSYTNAAATELQSRLADKVGVAAMGVHCSTLHSWLFACLRRYGSAIGLPPDIAVIDEATAGEILAETVREHGYRGTKKELQEALADVPFLLRSKGLLGARLVSAAYHLRLLQSGLMSFDGILAYGLHLIKTIGLTWKGLQLICGDHLLCDEVQDANSIDWRIYKAANFANKFFVGDIDQSIFRFRGADPKCFLDVANSYHKDRTLFTLTANYRSGSAICAAANRLIGHNVQRIPKEIVAIRKGGEVVALSFADESKQRNSASLEIGHALERGESCAVLCRTNWQADEYADFLRAQGLPVFRRADSFKNQPTLDWSMARLAVAFFAQPENDLLAFQVARMLRGDEVALAFRRKAALAMRSINQECLQFKPGPVEGVPEALARMSISKESVALIQRLIAEITGDATMATLTLKINSGDALTPSEGQDSQTSPVNAVSVATIHGYKGKEADCVFLPSWNEELFPAKADGEDLEECRRLAFVAVTRARQNVWIGCPKEGRTYAKAFKPVALTPSRFVKELGLTME